MLAAGQRRNKSIADLLVRQSPTDKTRMAPRMRVAPKGWLIAILFGFAVLAASSAAAFTIGLPGRG